MAAMAPALAKAAMAVGGPSGTIYETVLSPPAFNVTNPLNAGTAGGTTSTSTGATGGAGGLAQANL